MALAGMRIHTAIVQQVAHMVKVLASRRSKDGSSS